MRILSPIFIAILFILHTLFFCTKTIISVFRILVKACLSVVCIFLIGGGIYWCVTTLSGHGACVRDIILGTLLLVGGILVILTVIVVFCILTGLGFIIYAPIKLISDMISGLYNISSQICNWCKNQYTNQIRLLKF